MVDRYWLCGDDCTTDCGACKGAGRPAAVPDPPTCQALSQCVNALGRHDRRCPAAVPDPRFRDQLAEALQSIDIAAPMTPMEFADALIATGVIAAEVEARIQAAAAPLLAKLRAVEELHRPIDPDGYPAEDDVGYCADDGFIWPCATRRALDAS